MSYEEFWRREPRAGAVVVGIHIDWYGLMPAPPRFALVDGHLVFVI